MKPQGILRATTINMIGRFAGSLLGFLQFVVIAKIFGIGTNIDAFLIAQTIPLLFFTMSETVLGYSFLPVFIDYREKNGEDEAWKIAEAFSTILIGTLSILMVLLFIFAPYITTVLAPGLSQDGHSLATMLLRVMSPVIVIVGISGLSSSIFNSYQHFTIPAVASSFMALGVIASTLLFSKSIGITAVAYGVVVGLFLQSAVLTISLSQKKGAIRISGEISHPGVKEAARLMGPRFLGLSLNRIDVMVDRIFASTLGSGYISALTYADKIIQFFCTLLPIALGKSMMPVLSKYGAAGEHEDIKKIVTKAIGIISFIFIPVTIVLILLGNPIISILFQRGAFDEDAVKLTNTALIFFALGLIAFSFNIVLGGVFYSLKDTLTPLNAGAIGSILKVILNAMLIGVLAHGGLALATSIVAVVRSIIMYRLLVKKIGGFDTREIMSMLLKLSTAGAAVSVIMWIVKNYGVNTLWSGGFVSQGTGIAITMVTGIAAYLSACSLLKIPEYNEMVAVIGTLSRNALVRLRK